jgi:hypothetical protein
MKTDERVAPMYDGAGQLVTPQGAADAVKWFAELWASTEFDCGPQDYEYMVQGSIEALRSARAGSLNQFRKGREDSAPERLLQALSNLHRRWLRG